MTKTWESSLTAHSPITSTLNPSASPIVTFTVLPSAFSYSSWRHLVPSYQYHLPDCCNSLTGPLLFLFYPSLNLWEFSPQLVFLFFLRFLWQYVIYLSLAVQCGMQDLKFPDKGANLCP